MAALEEMAKKWIESFNKKDLNELMALYADQCVNAQPHLPTPLRGKHAIEEDLAAFMKAFPDARLETADVLVKGDTVVVRLVVEGTHKGNLLGFPATNRHVRWDAIDMYRIANGKITDDWASEDGVKILADIGAYIPPWMKGGN